MICRSLRAPGLAMLAVSALATSASAKPKLTVHSYDVEGTPVMAERLEQLATDALRGDTRASVVNFFELLDPRDGIAAALGKADVMLIDAESSFTAMELDKAKQLLDEAIKTYVRYLPQLAARGNGTQPLRDAWIKIAKVRFFDGDATGAKEALRYAFSMDRKLGFSAKLFPPQMKKLVVESKLATEGEGTGTISIDSDPIGATVYINGQKLDKTTPCDANDIGVGPVYLSFERRNYAPVTTVYEHASHEAATTAQTLPRYPNNPLGPINRARSLFDKSAETPPTLAEATKILSVDLLMLLRAQRTEVEGGPPKWKLSVYLYDGRIDKVVRRTERIVADDEIDKTMRLITRDAMSEINDQGVWEPPKAKPVSRWEQMNKKTRADFERFYAWKGFWGVVGGVAGAVVVGVAVGAGVGAHQQQVRNSLILFGGN